MAKLKKWPECYARPIKKLWLVRTVGEGEEAVDVGINEDGEIALGFRYDDDIYYAPRDEIRELIDALNEAHALSVAREKV